MIIFNVAGFILGAGSLVFSLAVGTALGWVRWGDAPQSSDFDHVVILTAGLLLGGDLAWRLRNVRTLNVADAPTIFTRDGPVATKPEPFTKALNLFLSGEKGAQFFWVVPGWVAGALVLLGVFTQ